MNTRKTKPLAKVFWPVLLLSAALALPADTQASPSHKSRQAHTEKIEKNQQKKAKKAQKQALQQHRRTQAERQAELNRQAEIQRQLALQRQAELNRQAQLRREAELRRQAQLRQRNRYDDRYRYDGRYRDDGRYYESQYRQGGTIVVDGYLTNEGYRCQALRDDNGELYMLVGNTYGLRTGDHARVVGRVADGGYCDWEGTAFEITDVKALWADRRHQSVYYHHSYDGERFGHRNNWLGRHPRLFRNRIERY